MAGAEHLQTVSDNRKRGAAKAAETRKKRKAQKRSQEQHQLYFCGVCQDPYMDVTDNAECGLDVNCVTDGFTLCV